MYLYEKSVLFLLISSLFFVNGELRVPTTEENPSCDDDGLHINLTRAEIRRIDEKFLASPLVNCLTLKDNLIWEINEKAFEELPNLHYLDLSGNNVPNDTFNYNLSTIKTLVLDNAIAPCYNRRDSYYNRRTEPCEKHPRDYYYKLEKLRFPILSTLPNLEKLYLRNNLLQSLSWNLAIPNITHLYLDNNVISLKDLIAFIPPTLTHLFLSYNFINQFVHPSILRQLEELILDGNAIRILCHDCDYSKQKPQLPYDPEEPKKSPWDEPPADKFLNQSHMALVGAIELKKLSLASNVLQEILDDAFTDLGNLRYLNLSNNLFSYIQPDAFKGAENLTTLSLSNNKLKRVPDFSNLENLEMLMLDGNNINAIKSSSFLGLGKLEILSLANNLITQIDSTLLRKLPSLYELDLSRNQLKNLPANWLSRDSPLSRIHLDKNLFTNIESMSLNNVTDLEYLNIAGNPFQLLSVKSLIQLPENTVINAEVISFNGGRVQRSADGV